MWNNARKNLLVMFGKCTFGCPGPSPAWPFQQSFLTTLIIHRRLLTWVLHVLLLEFVNYLHDFAKEHNLCGAVWRELQREQDRVYARHPPSSLGSRRQKTNNSTVWSIKRSQKKKGKTVQVQFKHSLTKTEPDAWASLKLISDRCHLNIL